MDVYEVTDSLSEELKANNYHNFAKDLENAKLSGSIGTRGYE